MLQHSQYLLLMLINLGLPHHNYDSCGTRQGRYYRDNYQHEVLMATIHSLSSARHPTDERVKKPLRQRNALA